MDQDKLIEIKLPKSILFLTPSELNKLLASDPDIWKRALKRGKHIKRDRAEMNRKG